MAIMIQVAHVPGQYSVGLSMNGEKYVTSYGFDCKEFPRTPDGLLQAVKEFESNYAHALTCAAEEVFK